MSVLSDADRQRIEAAVRRTALLTDPAMADADLAEAAALAVDLYGAAARHGIEPGDADEVTSFVHAAVSGVRLRERRRSAGRWPA